MLSAKTETALEQMTTNLATYFKQHAADNTRQALAAGRAD